MLVTVFLVLCLFNWRARGKSAKVERRNNTLGPGGWRGRSRRGVASDATEGFLGPIPTGVRRCDIIIDTFSIGRICGSIVGGTTRSASSEL